MAYMTTEPVKHGTICTDHKLQLVMFDLTKMMIATLCGLVWILVVKDHFTKYTWAEAFKNKDSRTIARYLFTIFKEEGAPERWHSDNGGEFLGEYFVAAMALLVAYGYAF